MPSRFIILTVTPAGQQKRKQYTLQLQKEDKHLTLMCNRLAIIFGNQTIEITDALTAYKRWGRITHPSIHEWIINKRLQNTPPRNPAKLIFKMSITKNLHTLILYPYQGNLL